MNNSFRPDWSEIWTAEQSEKELPDFTFKGPGFYSSKGDTLLVIPLDRSENIWKQTWTPEERFEFNVYNMRNPAEIFNRIVNAPHRE